MSDGKDEGAPGLTATAILASATDHFLKSGFHQVAVNPASTWPTDRARLFEDAYTIACLLVFDSFTHLANSWPDAQATLVELISTHISRAEAKAWEGYLVLLSPAESGPDGIAKASRIRYDTSRLRKLVATGEDLRGLRDVERVLQPLLALRTDTIESEPESVLSKLPQLLESRGIALEAARVLVDAFLKQEPLMEHLHAYRAFTSSNANTRLEE